MSILTWFQNPCRLFHSWRGGRRGGFQAIRSAERFLAGENIMKHPDGGWVRYQRTCKYCGMTQYLRTLPGGVTGRWDNLPAQEK